MFTIKNSAARVAGGAFIVASLSACSGTPVPQTQLTQAKVSTSAAEALGARTEPNAALHLKMAEDAIASAEKFIANGENDKALILLQRAEADAQVARMMSEAAVMKASTDKAIKELEALKSELRAQGGQS